MVHRSNDHSPSLPKANDSPQQKYIGTARPSHSNANLDQLLPTQLARRLGGAGGTAESLATRRAMILRAAGRDPDLGTDGFEPEL